MKKSIAYILTAGVLWGLMGSFTRLMSSLGFESSGTVIVRCSIAAVLFGITLLIKDRSLFRVHLRDIWLFLGSGLCSMLFFTYCYFQAINLTSLATAAILLYTAPSMVMVMSLFIFREKLTANKVAALVMAFLGCCLVSGLGSGSLALSTKGLIYGLCGGFGYALYSIFATLAMNKGYNSLTINFYTCLFAAIGACIIWGGTGPIVMAFSSVKPAVSSLTMGLVSCYLPYLLYTRGLRDVEAGKASIMASVEPVVAAIMGFAVFHESMSFLGALGILLVLGAVVVLNLNFEKKAKKS